VLNEDVEIHGRENFPTLRITLHKLIVLVRRKLREAGLTLHHVKLNGGAASYVVSADDFTFNDLDLIFPMDLNDTESFEKVRNVVFQVLFELMPDSTNIGMLCPDVLRDIYIRKMVKVADGDRWSLFSLHNDFGRYDLFLRNIFEFFKQSHEYGTLLLSWKLTFTARISIPHSFEVYNREIFTSIP
jgi:hypothetical protein